jgi:DNA-binding GntR family transcriptional regulator
MEREADRFRDAGEFVECLGDWMMAPGPLYHRLAAALRRAVQTCDLQPAGRLPSERRLATLLAVR